MDQNVQQILANQKNIFITGDTVFLAHLEWLLILQNKAVQLVMSYFLTIHQLIVAIVKLDLSMVSHASHVQITLEHKITIQDVEQTSAKLARF